MRMNPIPNPNPNPNPNHADAPRIEQKEEKQRNWAELNGDVLMLIFRLVGIIGVLKSAGSVCRAWRHVAKDEPELWRRIDMTDCNYGYDALRLMNLTVMAINRSGDRLEEFWIKHFGDDYLLKYLSQRTSVLKSLRLISCFGISDEALINTIKKLPFLEDLQITFGIWTVKLPELVGRAVPNLKHFKFNCTLHIPLSDPSYEKIVDSEETFGIAETMHQLRSLQLIANMQLANKGLKAILEGCPHLESLDIRKCYNVNMDSDMWAQCARLTTLRLPDDSLDDFEFRDDFKDDDEMVYDNEFESEYLMGYDDEFEYGYEDEDQMVYDDGFVAYVEENEDDDLENIPFNYDDDDDDEPIDYDDFAWDMHDPTDSDDEGGGGGDGAYIIDEFGLE